MEALVGIPIAIAAVVTAFLQWKCMNHQIIAEHFEQRFQVYNRIRKIAWEYRTSDKFTPEMAFEFALQYDRSKFLFGPEIRDYLFQEYNAILEELDRGMFHPEKERQSSNDDPRIDRFFGDTDRLFETYLKLDIATAKPHPKRSIPELSRLRATKRRTES